MTPPISSLRLAHALLLAATLLAAACARGINYPLIGGPRYAGVVVPQGAGAAEGGRSLRVVTFNVQYGVAVDSAIAVLARSPELRAVDVVALQEVDAPATGRIAAALGMGYVYYPATIHPRYDRDFGNAVLSRWPIVEDRKVMLPNLGRLRKTQRIATAVTIVFGATPIRVYSTHLGTPSDVGPGGRREQARAIVADAEPHRRVMILGDMNSHGVGKALVAGGYAWATRDNPRTSAFGNWDHVFLKGIALVSDSATGVVDDNRRASDHRAVWAEVASPRDPE